MSEFLLLAVRPPGDTEMSLRRVAHDVVASAAWHGLLRRWGLLRSFALPEESVAGLRACLLVRATGQVAAARLAAGWGSVSGYQVTVLRTHQ
jgi:hypothetical protein